MSTRLLTNALAILLTLTFLVPAAFFVAPERASAAGTSCIGGLIGLLGSAGSSATSVPTADSVTQQGTTQTAGTTMGTCLNELVIVPAARAVIRTLLKAMTDSVINFISGRTGGNRQPSFVQDLSTHLQQVGTVAANSFINQIGQVALGGALQNPYFGSAIAMALNANYLRNTSLAGFFVANACTLSNYSPNVNRFLAGDWSQGGAAAWFALTTQDNNNPYAVYLAAQSQMGSNVNQVQTNRRQDLIQSQGFLSFCPGDTTSATASDTVANWCSNCTGAGGTCDLTTNECVDPTGGRSAASQWGTSSSVGVNPGAPCTNTDGTPAQATTPGSVIHDYSAKALGSGWDQLVSANDIDQSLGLVVSALITNAFNGTGVFGSTPNPPSSSSGKETAFNSLLGTGYSADSQNLLASVASTADEKLAQLDIYTSAWDTIRTSATTASTSVQALIQFCAAQRDAASTTLANPTANQNQDTNSDPSALTATISNATKQITAAQTVLTKQVAQALAQAQTASTTALATKALALKIQTATTTSNADTQSLISGPPSITDIRQAQQDAQANGGATANPVNSLTISGGTLVDQMNLISKNATMIQAAGCTVPPPASAAAASSNNGFKFSTTPSLNPQDNSSLNNPINDPIGIFGGGGLGSLF